MEALQSLKGSLTDLMYLESHLQPTIEDFKTVLSPNEANSERSSEEDEFQTLDVECLQLACQLTTPQVQALFQLVTSAQRQVHA